MEFTLRDAIHYLHQPPADADTSALLERTHPAWRRVQLEELLAQQISLKQAHAIRRGRTAPSNRKALNESKSLQQEFNDHQAIVELFVEQRLLCGYNIIKSKHQVYRLQNANMLEV